MNSCIVTAYKNNSGRPGSSWDPELETGYGIKPGSWGLLILRKCLQVLSICYIRLYIFLRRRAGWDLPGALVEVFHNSEGALGGILWGWYLEIAWIVSEASSF